MTYLLLLLKNSATEKSRPCWERKAKNRTTSAKYSERKQEIICARITRKKKKVR
jgi:hypothetical protein